MIVPGTVMVDGPALLRHPSSGRLLSALRGRSCMAHARPTRHDAHCLLTTTESRQTVLGSSQLGYSAELGKMSSLWTRAVKSARERLGITPRRGSGGPCWRRAESHYFYLFDHYYCFYCCLGCYYLVESHQSFACSNGARATPAGRYREASFLGASRPSYHRYSSRARARRAEGGEARSPGVEVLHEQGSHPPGKYFDYLLHFISFVTPLP